MSQNGKILLEAHELINGERQKTYGHPVLNFFRVARFWSDYLGHPVSVSQVPIMLALLKIARESENHKKDNLVDACGYLGLAEDIAGNGND